MKTRYAKCARSASKQQQQESVTVHVPILVETENITTAQKRPAAPLGPTASPKKRQANLTDHVVRTNDFIDQRAA